MQKVKIRPADFPVTSSRMKIDIPVVLSLAGIISVAAVIGAAAFHSGIFKGTTKVFTSMFMSSSPEKMASKSDMSKEIARLNKSLADVSSQLQKMVKAQISATKRIDKIEDAFTSITAAIPASNVMSSSPYYRLLDTGWNADDMVTRRQKRDRIALLKSEAIGIPNNQVQLASAPAQTQYAVELASYENIITARNAWKKLNQSNGTLLKTFEPHLLPSLGKNNEKSRVKLIVGPIKTATQAAQVCSVLRSNGQVCQERLFSTSNIMVVSAPENSNIN